MIIATQRFSGPLAEDWAEPKHGLVLLRFPGITIYHSEDSVPYGGLPEILRAQQIHLALLPVNGRDSERLAKGIAGNFTLAEAIDLCRLAQIPTLARVMK